MKNPPPQLLRQAPITLCQLLSPETSPRQVAILLKNLVNNPTLLELVIECANQHWVIATLYARLNELALPGYIPADLNTYMQVMHEQQLLRNQRLKSQAQFIVKRLNNKGITPLLMKGCDTLFYGLYSSTGARFMSDLDILLPPGCMDTAWEELLLQGYSVPEKYQGSTPPLDPHHAKPLYKTGDDSSLELHYKPLNHKSGRLLATELAYEHARPVEELAEQGLQAVTLSPTHKVLHCFVHSEISHSHQKHDQLDIRQMDYFTRLLHYYGNDIEWPALQNELKAHGFGEDLAVYCDKAARLFDITVPVNLQSLQPEVTERRFKSCLKSAMNKHYPWRKFRLGVLHILGMYNRERLANTYPVETIPQYIKAVASRTRQHWRKFFATPLTVMLRLRQILF